MDDNYKKTVSEALLRQAVIDDHMNELNAIPSNDELAALYTFSARHEARMHALFNREEHKVSRVRFFSAMKRVAIFTVIVGTLIFSVLLTNPEVRAAVRATIVEWFDNFTRYSYNSPITVEKSLDWSFGNLPDGYALSDRDELGAATHEVYSNESLDEIAFIYSAANDASLGVDNEHSSLKIVYEDGIEYHVYEATSDEYQSRVIWMQNGYALKLQGVCSVEDLLRMAQSIKPQSGS